MNTLWWYYIVIATIQIFVYIDCTITSNFPWYNCQSMWTIDVRLKLSMMHLKLEEHHVWNVIMIELDWQEFLLCEWILQMTCDKTFWVDITSCFESFVCQDCDLRLQVEVTKFVVFVIIYYTSIKHKRERLQTLAVFLLLFGFCFFVLFFFIWHELLFLMLVLRVGIRRGD